MKIWNDNFEIEKLHSVTSSVISTLSLNIICRICLIVDNS